MKQIQKRANRCIGSLIIICILLQGIPGFARHVSASETVYERMLAKAEEIVNYTWTPQNRIATWNENPYKGKNWFEVGEEVVGMPYTLFSWELGSDSLLSLKQYKEIEARNYTASAYCNSIGADRVGPAYGSCCATFVSEVFGGAFMDRDNPKHDSVYGIVHSGYATTTYNVTLDKIKSGDALSNPEGSHILWIGEITDSTLTVYEQTPPVARKITVSRSSVDANGYFVYGNHIYNIVTRSNELVFDESGESSSSYEVDMRYPTPFKAYNLANEKVAAYDEVNGKRVGYIYGTDECTVQEIYTNGWCKVLCPWTGYSDDRVVYTELSVFLDTKYTPTKRVCSAQTTTYKRNDIITSYGYIGAGDTVTVVGENELYSQVIYPLTAGGYKCAWAALPGDLSLNSDYPVPFLSRTISEDKVICYNAIGGSSPGKIYPEDNCLITAVYENGWIQCQCPWSDGTTKTVYVPKSVFIASEFEITVKEVPHNINVYLRASMQENIGTVTAGTSVWAIAEISDKTQIVYFTETGKQSAWVYTSDLQISETVRYGDINGDGAIDGRDLIRLKKYLAEYDDETGNSIVKIGKEADCTGDGKIDGRDFIRLKKYLLNYDDELGYSTVILGPQ